MIWNPIFPTAALTPWRELAARAESRPQRFPAVRAHSGPEAVVIEALLPGVAREDLELAIEDDTLVLAGQLKPFGEARPALRERATGRFRRQLRLPYPVDAAQAEAELANGLLRVRLPRAAEHGPVRIQVRKEGE